MLLTVSALPPTLTVLRRAESAVALLVELLRAEVTVLAVAVSGTAMVTVTKTLPETTFTVTDEAGTPASAAYAAAIPSLTSSV